jgi:hypothetical protein
MNRQSKVIPESIVELQRRLHEFRSTQPRRAKLPESLWQAAVELARQHGVYPLAHPLRLDYVGSKKRRKRLAMAAWFSPRSCALKAWAVTKSCVSTQGLMWTHRWYECKRLAMLSITRKSRTTWD